MNAILRSLIWVVGIVLGPLGAWTQAAAPYRCGFVLESVEAIREVYGPELQVLDLQPGQYLADVGGSNGYRMGMFAALYDSLNVYIEDVDTLCLNAAELAGVIAWHSKLRGSPLNSEFELVLGDATHSNLPDGLFDKVLVTAAYHHFSDPEAMLRDLQHKLRPGGKLYLIENVVRRDGQRRRRLCNDPLWSADHLKAEFERLGLRVESVHPLGRWWTQLFVLSPMPE